jgi:hypothetical protein
MGRPVKEISQQEIDKALSDMLLNGAEDALDNIRLSLALNPDSQEAQKMLLRAQEVRQERWYIGLESFRSKVCRYVGEEFMRSRSKLGSQDIEQRVNDILYNLERKWKVIPTDSTSLAQGFHFSSEEIESDTLGTFVSVAYILITISFSINKRPAGKDEFLESLEKAGRELKKKGYFLDSDLRNSKNLILKYLETT